MSRSRQSLRQRVPLCLPDFRTSAVAQDSTLNSPVTYADAGVNTSRAKRTKQRIKYLAHKTFNKNVLSEIGGFGALFSVPLKYKDPILVSSVDGVGTKLKVAFEMNVHHTIGGDLVNHCVNDIAVQGAAPLFFMDYLATGKLNPEVAEKVVEGIAEACKHNGCALVGGETAEMPGFYPEGEYDLAGFIVGVVERERVITGKAVEVGDVILGLPSTGLHTNGYSLARKLLFEVAHYTPETYVNELRGQVGNELMLPHRSYWPLLRKLVDGEVIRAMAHITGGGMSENLPRVLPRGVAAVIELGSWPLPPIFVHLQKLGNVPQDEMLRTFNMGLGMLLVVPAAKFKKAQSLLERAGEKAFTVGRIVKGERKVMYT
ncbi:MAG: phosphoribosylformylglycinamidine cyclo-ligase [Acidobacteria bacterium]|nr:phosphoribosylformylglycinamidine cyclo-ligase [Acidobacteriota bacterium]